MNEVLDYQKIKDYESKITLLLDKYAKEKITDEELREQTRTILKETELTHDEIVVLVAALKKKQDEIGEILQEYK